MPIEEKRRVARAYHHLKLEGVERTLAPDFTGRRRPGSGFIWNRDRHRGYVTKHTGQRDVIHERIAEGDWLATRYTRTCTPAGEAVRLHMMHPKRFVGDTIAEIWGYSIRKQLS